jgi:hypothetical protein
MIPAKIRVKLVSEAAEYVTVSHVVQREFSLAELVEVMLPVLGRNALRIRQILHAGTLSTGDYRYRWEPVELQEAELEEVLRSFPGPDLSRPFDAGKCFLVRFRRGQETLDLPRDNAERKPLFARQSFWDGLLRLAQSARYADYSHADKADVFTVSLDAERMTMLRGLLPLLKPKSAAERLERLRPEQIEWICRR